MDCEDFAIFCGRLRKHELYNSKILCFHNRAKHFLKLFWAFFILLPITLGLTTIQLLGLDLADFVASRLEQFVRLGKFSHNSRRTTSKSIWPLCARPFLSTNKKAWRIRLVLLNFRYKWAQNELEMQIFTL